MSVESVRDRVAALEQRNHTAAHRSNARHGRICQHRNGANRNHERQDGHRVTVANVNTHASTVAGSYDILTTGMRNPRIVNGLLPVSPARRYDVVKALWQTPNLEFTNGG